MVLVLLPVLVLRACGVRHGVGALFACMVSFALPCMHALAFHALAFRWPACQAELMACSFRFKAQPVPSTSSRAQLAQTQSRLMTMKGVNKTESLVISRLASALRQCYYWRVFATSSLVTLHVPTVPPRLVATLIFAMQSAPSTLC
jgi:hypothetical protein